MVAPKFIFLLRKDGTNGTSLRLVYNSEYYRDGGQWSVGFKEVDGSLVTVSDMPQLNGLQIKECTEEEWRKDNGEYAPKDPFWEDKSEENILGF